MKERILTADIICQFKEHLILEERRKKKERIKIMRC